MIVSPDSRIVSATTAVMCSAALYAAELSSQTPDPLRRVFVGVPNQLTLPPGFSESEDIVQEEDCAPRIGDRTRGAEVQKASDAAAELSCASETKADPAAIVLPVSPDAAKDERAVLDSLSTAVRAH